MARCSAQWLLGLIVGLAVSGVVEAAIVNGAVGSIKSVYTYSDFGTGDMTFQVTSPLATCPDGFWIRMTDAGAKTLVAEVLMAVSASMPISAWGYDDAANAWSGSSGHYCRLYVLSFVGV